MIARLRCCVEGVWCRDMLCIRLQYAKHIWKEKAISTHATFVISQVLTHVPIP